MYTAGVMRRNSLPLNVIFLVTALVYAQVVGFGFADYDDILLVTGNPTAHGLSWTNISTAFTTYDPELYVPLTLLSYQIEYSIAELEPWIYHATNLALHLLAVWLVFRCVTMLAEQTGKESQAPWIAAFVAGIFALHPLNVQSVAWVAARKDILSSVFFFATLYNYLKYRETDSRRAYRWSILLFACGLLSKVSIVFAPIVLLLTDLLTGQPFNKKNLRTLSPYFGLSALLGIVALFGKVHQLQGAGIGELLLLGTHSTFFIVQKMVIPIGLTLFYPFEGVIALSEPKLLISIAVTLLLLAMMPLLWKRFRIASYGIGFFFLLLSPSFLNAWKNGYLDITFDKYVYAAMPGLLLPVGFLLANVSQKTQRTVTIALCVILIPLTFVQAQTWHDSATLLEQNIRLQPSSTHALVNLGTTTYQSGDVTEALSLYTRAIAIDPDLAVAHLNIARIHAKQGNLLLALEEAKKASIAAENARFRHTDDIESLFYYGSLLDQTGKSEEAIAQFARATEIAPNAFIAHLNYGIMLRKYNQPEKAFAVFSRAVELNGSSLEARYHMAATAGETGRIDIAIEQLEYVVGKDPNYEDAAMHLHGLKRMK